MICLNEWLTTAEPHDYWDYIVPHWKKNSAKLPRQKLKWLRSARAVDPESTYDVIVDDEGHHQQGLCETVGWDYYGVFFLNGTDACEMALRSESLGVKSRPAAWLLGCPCRWMMMMKEGRNFRRTKVTLDICSTIVPARAVAAE